MRRAGGELPPLKGMNRVPRAKPNAATLLAHPTSRSPTRPAPVLVASDAGRDGAGVADRGLALGVPGGRRRGQRRAFQRSGERDPLAGARSGAHAAAHRFSSGRRPAQQPISARARVHADYTPAANVQVASTSSGPAARPTAEPLRGLHITTDDDGEARGRRRASPRRLRLTGTRRSMDASSLRTRPWSARAVPAGRRRRARSRAAELAQVSRRDYATRSCRARVPPFAQRPHRTQADRGDLVASAAAPAGPGAADARWTLRRRSGHA